MRANKNIVSLALCALMMFGFALTAEAQLTHLSSQVNNEVVRYGLTELMGEVRFTRASLPAAQTSVFSTITITYQGSAINNLPSGIPADTGPASNPRTITYPNGVQLTLSGVQYSGSTISVSGSNTALGGQLIITIPAGLTPAAGDFIAVNGARTDVSAKSVGSTIAALITSSPSTANNFDQVNVTVATVNNSLEITVSGVTAPICVQPVATQPTIRVREGFAGAWVQYTTGPINPRTRFGATGNTRIRLQVNNLPSGVVVSWPTTVNASGASQVASLTLDTSTVTSSVAVYTFNTTDQGTSDTIAETFVVNPIVSVPATSGFGQSTAQAQLWPDSSSTAIIRFAHPLVNDPADNFVNVTKCVTYLLFPFVTAQKVTGFTTGIAIANTSSDDAAFGGSGTGATAQSGAITFYSYPESDKAADGSSGTVPAAVTTVVTPNLTAGDTWTGVVDSLPSHNGFQGYIIAKCDFQFGHGFAFIVGDYSPGSGAAFDVAQGYLALVIPDPTIVVRVTTSGETLGQ